MTESLMFFHKDPLAWLHGIIGTELARWRSQTRVDCWRDPLVSAAAADHPLFLELRSVVDPHHALPNELLHEARSIIVFFIPFQEHLGQENDRAPWFASRGWAEAYVATNQLIEMVSASLRTALEKLGYATVTTPPTHNFDAEKLVSRWSHKHLGYIAGLGTFGHHHLLITPAGCCGRLGSLVTTAPLPATGPRAEELCLAKAGRKCHACVAKCLYGALSKGHFDRQACYRQCLRNDAHHHELPLTDVCGKCGCEVPCSYQVPAARKAMKQDDPSTASNRD